MVGFEFNFNVHSIDEIRNALERAHAAIDYLHSLIGGMAGTAFTVIDPSSGVNVVADGVASTLKMDGISGITVTGTEAPDTITIASTITQYTDELAQDAVGGMAGASLVYLDEGPALVRAALTGDVTAAQNSNSTVITAGAVTETKIAAGAVTNGKIANSAVTFAKIQNPGGTSRLLGRGTVALPGDYEEILLGTNLSMSGQTLNAAATSGASKAFAVAMGAAL